jgi:hypothetical protein
MASVFEKYPNLPGFATEFKDGGLQVRTEVPDPGTDSILLLGTAIDGPTGEPVAVDPNTVELIFGGSTYPNGIPNGSTLVRAFYEAWQGGSRDIRLMRVTGSPASINIDGQNETRTEEKLKSEELEVAPGNDALDIVINDSTASITSVKVGSRSLRLTTDYTKASDETAGTTTVTVLANKVNVGDQVKVNYKIGEESSSVTEVAVGTEFVRSLSNTPEDGTLRIYSSGVELDSTQFTLAGQDVTIKPGGNVRNGSTLEARYIVVETVTDDPSSIKLESVFSGSTYNLTKVKVVTEEGIKKVVITKPDSKKAQVAEEPLVYSSEDHATLHHLVEAINADTRNNIVRATVSKRFATYSASDLADMATTNFSGGDDGIEVMKQEMFDVLGGNRSEDGLLTDKGVYHLLENYTVDTIVPLGVYADDVLPGKYDNFASQLALACAVISHRNHATNGVIATSSPDESGLAAVQAHVDKLLASKNDYFMRDRVGNVLQDADGKGIDLGRYISVVAGPDVILGNSRLGNYSDNSAAGYAGFVSQLAPQSSPTNKVMDHVGALRYSFSSSQLDKLTAARYVTFHYKNNGANVAVVDGPTAAQPNSDYRRISTIRVVKEAVNELRNVCDPYIGEPNETPQRNAMSAAISKRLGRLVESGVIADYDFSVVSTPQMRLMGEAQIELTLVPPLELRKITTIVSLRPSL